MLTLRNIERMVKYIRLFGLIATFKDVSKRLLLDGKNVLKGSIKIIPIRNDIDIIRKETASYENATVSIVIPVKNAGDDLWCLLSLMRNQKGFKDIEIIIVDSGSTDGSLEISEEFGAKIIKILPEEFSHSHARNLAAEQSSGDYLLFTVQDALPSSDLWLHELFSVIKDNDVVAVSCTEFPGDDVDLFYRAVSWYHNRFMEVDKQDRIMCKPVDENHLTLRKNGQLSDVACLISKDVFMKYKFRGNYAEDLDLGMRLIRAGYKLALLGSTKNIHSHNRPAYYHLKRGYVDNLFMSQILPDRPLLNTEAERLFSDIVFTYRVVDSLVHEDLQRITLPCSTRKMSRNIIQKFRAAASDGYPVDIDMATNGYFDSEFKSFLDNVYTRYYSEGENKFPYDGVLLGTMQSFTMMILEYVDDTYEQIDDVVVEEFKSCLCKAYAFQCGIQLASCYLQSSKATKERLNELNNELTQGI